MGYSLVGADMRRLATVALVAAAVGVLAGAAVVATVGGPAAETPTDPTNPGTETDPPAPAPPTGEAELEQFDSAEAFQRYVRAAGSRPGVGVGPRVGVGRPGVRTTAVQDQAARGEAAGGGDGGRVSSTNVQERGIDEPDVLKTDGEDRVAYYTSRRLPRRGPATGTGTRVIDVDDPADPSVIGTVDENGRMLLTGDRLVVLSEGAVRGYDVSDPSAPERAWERSVNGTITAARLLDGQVYLVVQSRPTVVDCPVEPLAEGPSVPCTEVYHPTRQVSAPTTYTVVSLSPDEGTVEGTESVVGSRGRAVTYVSEDAVFLSYTQHRSRAELFVEFALSREKLDQQARDRLREVRSYDLSPGAYRAEVWATVQAYAARADDGVSETVGEAFQSYLTERRREVVTTGVVRVGIGDGPTVEAHGEVPGTPLNQFSMDEHEGRLRIATTVPSLGGEPSVNDVYVLDEDLAVTGAARGMGEGQRVYAARFVEDTAYLVTFRRVDPFHVVDLSDPATPEELGAVELPGFSRYLHPLGNERVLGIGQEDGQVKAVVFDASDPSDPRVVDSEIVGDRWSAVRQSHHAFLQDERHGIAFVPGSRGGHVFDYDTDAEGEAALELQTRVDVRDRAVRAAYVDDYLYVFGTSEVAVVDERDWDRVATLSLTDDGE